MTPIRLVLSLALLVGLAGCTSVPIPSASSPKFDVDRNLFPFESRYLTLSNGARVHYVDEGQGPVLLLLHGNPTWSFLYRDIIAALKGDFRLIAPDYPGFGLSSAPAGYGYTAAEHAAAMSGLVEKLDLKDVTIVMQDWGGPIGFALAEQHPERVRGLVIGNTWAWPLERTGQKMFSALMGGWPGQFAAWCCNGVVRFFMWKGVATGLSDAALEMYLAPFKNQEARAPTHIFPKQLQDASPFLENVYRNLNKLADRPALILWGQKDFAFQEPERLRFETLFPNHQTVLLENAGHFIQEDAHAQMSTAIRAWHLKISGAK